MNRNLELKNKRTKFVKLCDENLDLAVQKLKEEADALSQCKKSVDKIFALSQILCVSESTIEKDLYS